ncbi:MAG TPA: penicillin-binding transpeptidase domain-containing protein, partial [Ilumatobacteraceae bacterium]
LSINCAYSRLAQVVGLHRVVNTTYEMAHSDYLYSGQTKAERNGVDPVMPYASFATGANEMSPLDMASGAQTIANNGLHHDPYYVEYIDRADGSRLYTHSDPGTQVLDQNVALTEISVLKGVITSGTGRHYPLANGRPAAGKTGTQDDNTNAWFVGMTPQLTTSVWVGNPNGYIKMNNVPEFVKDGVSKVQGGTYPDKIWKAYMDAALDGQPPLDWAAAPASPRKAARLYLPGSDCIGKLVSGVLAIPGAPTTPPPKTTVPKSTEPAAPPAAPPASEAPAGPPDTSTGSPEPPPGTDLPESSTTTTAPKPLVKPLDPSTTISPDVLDPHAPVPSVDPKSVVVYNCVNGIPGAIISATTSTTTG